MNPGDAPEDAKENKSVFEEKERERLRRRGREG